MREIAVAAFALLVGLIAGGVGPRAELNAMMKTVDAVDLERCKNTVGKDLATFFGGAREGGLPPVVAAAPRPQTLRQPTDPEVEAALAELEEGEAQATEELQEGLRDTLANRDELELARSALELRRAQARAALVEEADLDRAQAEEVDGVYDEMNGTLEELAAGMAEMVVGGREPDRREAMEFAAEALDAMLVAEDRVLRVLDAEQRSELGQDAANPFNHVSPQLIDVLEAIGSEAEESP